MFSRLEQLQQQQRQFATDLAGQREAIRAAKQQAKQAAKAQARQWVLNQRERRVALIAYVLAGYTAEAAAKFLESVGQQRSWAQKDEAELCRIAEDIFLSFGVDELADLTDLEAPSDIDAIRLAVDYVEQWRVVAWARRLNVTAGLAPSTASVLDQFAINRGRLPEQLRPPDRGTVVEPRSRAWVRRWRQRWGGHFGKLRVREPISIDEARNKAPRLQSLGSGNRWV